MPTSSLLRCRTWGSKGYLTFQGYLYQGKVGRVPVAGWEVHKAGPGSLCSNLWHSWVVSMLSPQKTSQNSMWCENLVTMVCPTPGTIPQAMRNRDPPRQLDWRQQLESGPGTGELGPVPLLPHMPNTCRGSINRGLGHSNKTTQLRPVCLNICTHLPNLSL